MTGSEMEELSRLREELTRLDVELLERVARRQQIVAQIGRVKSSGGRGTRDFQRELEVLRIARETAQRLGIDPEVGEELFKLLIRTSLAAQERDRVAASDSGAGKRALVIGGAGQMGRWFVRFLDSQGYQVQISDPGGEVPGCDNLHPLQGGQLDHELIVITAPILQSAEILRQLAQWRPPGVILEIGSLKGPLQAALEALVQAGCRVCPLHPLFGPDAELLSGRNLILVDLGCSEATAAARELFAPTMVDVVEMSMEHHDRAMAYVLGLSHAVNIAFFSALAEGGEEASALARLSSTTFDAQLDVAQRVACENPYLYFEVQSLNSHAPRAMVALLNAVTRVAGRVLDGDQQGFVELMAQGKRFLSGRPEDRP